MTEEQPTLFLNDEAALPDDNPFAAQIEAILQLPEEIKNDPVRLQAFIAEVLHETEPGPLEKIAKVIELTSPRKALKLLRQTLRREAKGGMFIFNGKRRRTIGGIYFFYCRHWFEPTSPTPPEPKNAPEPKKTSAPARSLFEWADRIALIQEAVKEAGQANIPKLTLMGRPGRIIEKGNVVLTTLPPKPQPKSLPQGLPTLPEAPTTPYILYINAKQWRKVKEALANPEDELIIEGYPAFSPQLKAITVFALNTTTKLLEQSRRKK